MNINVQADTLVLGATASFVSVKVSTTSHLLPNRHITLVGAVCLSSFQLSLNGHSVSAINPEISLIGGMTTSIAA